MIIGRENNVFTFQLLSYFFILFCFFKLFWEIVTGIFIVDGAVVDIVV